MVARSLLAALPLVGVAQAAIIEHWWNISYTTANPDTLFERRVIGVNGTWPPPILMATQGDTHLIHAYNGLGDDKVPTALHAHGMFFNGTNQWDGAVGVTQCGIPNGQTLDYHIDTSLNHGTYWIHGHYSGQYVDGLRSPNIILPKTPRSDNVTWDDEYVIIAGDWYHKQHDDMLHEEFMTWKNPTGAEPVPESAAIYIAHNGSYLGNPATGEGVNDDAKITFEPGKKYRLRVIAMTALSMFHFGIQDHEMKIIEVDGVEIAPTAVENVAISAAQRYSVLVEAKNATDKNYAMMFCQDEDMYDQVPEALILNNTLQIVYSDKNAKAEPFFWDEYTEMNETAWVPVEVEASFQPTVSHTIHANFDTYDDGTNRASWTMDGGFQNVTYRTPNVPSIFSAMSMGSDALNPAIYGAQTNAITFAHHDVIEMVVHNWDAGFHPFHLHGHVFQVIEKSFDVTSDDPVINPAVVDVQANPMRRDTIVIPPGGKVVLRWRADNPGAWFFHCHIDWHLSSGLAIVFVEAPDVMNSTLKIPQQMHDHCKFFNTPVEGNAVGRFSTTDLSGEPKGPYPLKMGWTPKAKGAMAGCVLTVLLGIATIVWYGTGELDEEELEEEIRRKIDAKKNKVPIWKKLGHHNQQQ